MLQAVAKVDEQTWKVKGKSSIIQLLFIAGKNSRLVDCLVSFIYETLNVLFITNPAF